MNDLFRIAKEQNVDIKIRYHKGDNSYEIVVSRGQHYCNMYIWSEYFLSMFLQDAEGNLQDLIHDLNEHIKQFEENS